MYLYHEDKIEERMVDYYYTNAIMGERPVFKVPNKEFLEQLTVEGFTTLVHEFYELIIESDISHFFPEDDKLLSKIKEKNGSYFIMICGGDERYISKFSGEFDQIKTHEMFSIPNKARLEWLGCWETVLKDIEKKVDAVHIQSYWNWLEVFSKHIVNYTNDRETLEDKVAVCPMGHAQS
jgi:hemoglobin